MSENTSTTEATTTEYPALGSVVTYVSTRGHKKAAFVVATPESLTEGHDSIQLGEGQINIAVLSPSNGSLSFRGGVSHKVLAKAAHKAVGAAGKATGYWK